MKGDKLKKLKEYKKGIFSSIQLLWSFMGKKEKLMFISISLFSFVAALAMMFSNFIPALVLASLTGESVKLFFIDLSFLSTINLLLLLSASQVFLWILGMMDYYLIDVFSRRMICVVNIKVQDLLLLERKNLDYGMTNGEVNYIVKNATDCIYGILEPFCWSIATPIISVTYMCIMLFQIDYVVGLCNIANIILILLCVFIRTKVQKPIVEDIERTNAKIGNHFLTSIQNLPLITMLVSKAQELKQLSLLNKKFYAKHKKRAKIGFWYWITIVALEYFGQVLCVSLFLLRHSTVQAVSSIALIFTFTSSVQNTIEQWGFIISDVLNCSIKLCNLDLIKPSNDLLKQASLAKAQILNDEKIFSIEAKDLSVEVGKFNACYNGKFDAGKLYLISGRSGKGKTTFINALCGLRETNGGQIIVNDQYYLSSLYDLRQKISYMFQDSILFDRSILENMSYPNEELNDEGKRLIDVFEMDKIAKRKDEEGNVAKSLSGGEKKRIDLIRSLSKEADIYIFDEPTNELDKLNIEKVLNEFSALKNKQKMVIVISHDKRLQTIADEIIEI